MIIVIALVVTKVFNYRFYPVFDEGGWRQLHTALRQWGEDAATTADSLEECPHQHLRDWEWIRARVRELQKRSWCGRPPSSASTPGEAMAVCMCVSVAEESVMFTS